MNPVDADHPPCRQHSHEPARAGGQPNGVGRIGADSKDREVGRHGGRCPARRASRREAPVVRVAGAPTGRTHGGIGSGKVRQIRVPENHGAGSFELRDDRRICGGN